jgi:diguanylate cyclase (GGDEF)-like protein
MMQKNDDDLSEQMKTFAEFTQRLDEAKKRALVDALTGLGSRAKGEAFLQHNLQAGHSLTVILINLDRFKHVNERWGRECGNQILKSLGRVLMDDSGPADLVCRWAGDSFLKVSQLEHSSREGEAARLRVLLSREYEVTTDGKSVRIDIGVSVGLAQSEAGDSVESVIGHAEADLARSKENMSSPRGLPHSK